MIPLFQGIAAFYAVLFLGAALGKLDGWRRWTATSYRLLPGHRVAARRVRVLIPAAEGAAATLAFVSPAVGLAACGGLLVFFAAVVAALSRRAAGEDCGCFGALMPDKLGPGLAVRDLAFALPALAAAVYATGAGVPALDGIAVVLALFVGLMAIVLAEFSRTIGFAELRPAGKVDAE